MCSDHAEPERPVRPLYGAGWWFNPDTIINELNIQSTITSPAHEEVVPLDGGPTYTIKGYAFTGTLTFGTHTGIYVGYICGVPTYPTYPAYTLATSDKANLCCPRPYLRVCL